MIRAIYDIKVDNSNTSDLAAAKYSSKGAPRPTPANNTEDTGSFQGCFFCPSSPYLWQRCDVAGVCVRILLLGQLISSRLGI